MYRVRLQATGRSAFWLLGDPGQPFRECPPANARWQIQRNQQSQGGSEWETMDFKDRKNQRVSCTLSSHITFDSNKERMDYMARLMHVDPAQQLHRWEGDVWLRDDEPGGYTEYCMPRAVISLDGISVSGEVKLLLTYRIQAGGISEIGGGAFVLSRLSVWSRYGPAEVETGADLNAFINTTLGYGGGYLQITRTNASNILQGGSWALAGYGSPGYPTPIEPYFASIKSSWDGLGIGGGLELLSGPTRLRVTSLDEGELAYASIQVLSGGLFVYKQASGGLSGLISPVIVDGKALVTDIGG